MEILLEQWQDTVLFDTHRYKVINAGRRCGKSTAAAIYILQFASNYKEKRTGYVWYIAPTYKQAKSIMWQMLLEITPPNRIVKRNETELTLTLDTNVIIHLKGAEDPDSLRGNRIDLAIFDEVAFHPKWEQEWAIMRPTIMDSQAECWFISTPNGFNHFKELSDNVNREGKNIFNPQYTRSFHYTTYDNTHIPKEEIEQAKSEMTEDAFAQEIMGEFRKMSGLIYKDFKRETHMVEIPDLRSFTFTRALDFGFAHKSALIYFAISPDGSVMYGYDGLYESNLTIPQIAEAAKIKDAGKIISNPVADSAQPASIQELTNLGVSFSPVDKEKDSVKNGIVRVAELLKIRADTGKPTLMFNKNLTWIADEFERYHWMQNMSADNEIKEVPYKANDDAMDAIRYFAMNYRKKVQQVAVYNKRKWSI